MLNTAAVTSLVESFADPQDGAAMKSVELILNLLAWSPEPFSRHQFTPGHITCSGLVLASDGRRILLVHHRRLGRWLLPGGHVEPGDDTAEETARREVVEETGALLLPAATLIGADVHGIPAKGQEPYHLHHDLLFCFRAAPGELRVSEESHAVEWCAPSDFEGYQLPPNVLLAWSRAQSKR